MGNSIKRQLSTIIFADIVGFSKSMTTNESKTLADLEIIETIIDDNLKINSGLMIKKLGDGFLMSYNSSVNAVESAINIQDKIENSNSELRLRIGIHLGDIIFRNDDVYGNGVNIAARVEPLAEPGGICITKAVYQSIQSAIEFDASEHLDLKLKNIFEEYTVYKYPKNDNEIELTSFEKKQFKIKKISDLPNFDLPPLHFFLKSILSIFIVSIPNIFINNIYLFQKCKSTFYNIKRFFVPIETECNLLSDNATGLYISPMFYNLTDLSIFNYGILSELLVAIFFIILSFPFSMIRKKRITFNHIKGVIDLLEENIYNIRSPFGNKIYSPKNKKIQKNGITYKLSRYGDFVSFGLGRYNVKIDGNSIIIEAPSSGLKQIVKILEAYSE